MSDLLSDLSDLSVRIGREIAEKQRTKDELRRAITKLRVGYAPAVVLAELAAEGIDLEPKTMRDRFEVARKGA